MKSLAQRFIWRWRAYRLGIWFFRWRQFKVPKVIMIQGNPVELLLPEDEKVEQEHELREIFIADRYRLSKVGRPVRRIVDVGANCGFFALAARQKWPEARIHCYEPNSDIIPSLSQRLLRAKVELYSEAIGPIKGEGCLVSGPNSLHSKVQMSPSGAIPIVDLATILSRMEGSIDLMKLDCEGGEWHALDCPDLWKSIREVVMEYHLWARPGASFRDIEEKLGKAGMRILFHQTDGKPWGLLHAARK